LDGYSFRNTVLRSINIGPLIINYSLPLYLLREKYDVYIIDDDPRLVFSKLITVIFAKFFGKKIVVWEEATEKGQYNKIKDIIVRYVFYPVRTLIFKKADAFIAWGKETQRFLIKCGIPENKIYLTTEGISKDQIMYGLDKGGIDKEKLKAEKGFHNKKVVLFVGYFSKRKGVVELIKAFKNLKRDDSVLVMVGAGEEERFLRSLASGSNNIFFTGYLDGMEKAIYYSLADIFVLPSFVDPWSLAIVEAMFFGLPIITTEGVGGKEAIDGNGIVIQPGDVDSLEKAINELLNDDELRKKMSYRSKKLAEEHTIDRIVQDFVKAIETVYDE
jgi:glycosyltransferase involved in cell wall biosynthesis